MNREDRRQLKKNSTERTNQMDRNAFRINGLTVKSISQLTSLTEKEINSLKRGEQYKIDNDGNIGDFLAYFEYKKGLLIIKSYIVIGRTGNTYTLFLQDSIIIYNEDFDCSNYENCMYTGSGADYNTFAHYTIRQVPRELFSWHSKFIDINLQVPVA